MSLFKSFKNPDDPLLKYVMDHSLRDTPEQRGLTEATLRDPRCRMLGAPESLQLNSNLIKLIGGKKILDVGVYTGASSLSSALAIPEDGKVYALDLTDEYLEIGRPFWKKAGVENKINLILGKADVSLQRLIDDGHEGTFDFAFVDADKPNMVKYFELCLVLVRPGGIISFDNTIWDGRVVDETDQTESTKGVRALNDKLKDDPRINLSFLTVGDGLSLCFKK